MENPIKITRGNGYWLDIPIEKIAKTAEGFVIEEIDLTKWKACTVNLVRKKVQYPVEFEFVDRTKLGSDGVVNVLRMKVNPNTFGRGLHGVEILALDENDINLRFYDDEAIEFVETTAEADIPDNVEFNISKYDLAPMAMYIPQKGDKGDSPVMSAEVVGSIVHIYADGEEIVSFSGKPEGGWNIDDFSRSLKDKIGKIDTLGADIAGIRKDFDTFKYDQRVYLDGTEVEFERFTLKRNASFWFRCTNTGTQMTGNILIKYLGVVVQKPIEAGEWTFTNPVPYYGDEIEVTLAAIGTPNKGFIYDIGYGVYENIHILSNALEGKADKSDIPDMLTTIKVANITKGLTSEQYGKAVAMFNNGIMPCFYDEANDYVWATTYYTGKGAFYIARTPIDEGKVTGATINVNSFSQKAEYDLKALRDGKQELLKSGTNIKTVNGQSLLGSGDLKIESGSSEALLYPNIEYDVASGCLTIEGNGAERFNYSEETGILEVTF